MMMQTQGRRRRLLLRGSTRRRQLKLLQEFEPGRVFSFVDASRLDDLPDDQLLWADEQYDDVAGHA